MGLILQNSIKIGKVQLGTQLNLKPPTAFTSSFTVDTILGQLNWTNNAGADAQYEVYSSTNGGADVLLATTAAGATSYQDTTCKQNASVVYKIRVKKGNKYSDLVLATALATPLCWKTNQSVLTAVVINQLKIAVGKSVTVNWGDGTSQAYSGNNANITKNYGATGQYNIWLSGDINFITVFEHYLQSKTYGNISNWIFQSAVDFSCNLAVNMFSGKLNFAGRSIELQRNYLSGSSVVIFKVNMTNLDIGSQNVVYTTIEIDKLLKALADWYQVNAPTANCTFALSGANMGIPTGGASNVDLVRLVGYYTAASKTATVIVRTS